MTFLDSLPVEFTPYSELFGGITANVAVIDPNCRVSRCFCNQPSQLQSDYCNDFLQEKESIFCYCSIHQPHLYFGFTLLFFLPFWHL
jgi:hypothetical protein